MSYWTFTDIFEENGPRMTPFHGGFGLINYEDLKKPAFYAFKFLNELGPTELKDADPASWVCKSPDGSVQALFWNYTPIVPPEGTNDQHFYRQEIPAKDFGRVQLCLTNLPPGSYSLTIYQTGYRANDVFTSYLDLGAPAQLTPGQVGVLREASNGDPAAHVFNSKLYIYPSHDIDSGLPENNEGDHFDMRDYHVLSLEAIDGPVTDHGVILDLKDIPWAGRQLWDSDCACKKGKYYLYFSLKDKNDVFHLGVAVSDTPEGPFIPQENPIKGSYSIDPCAFRDDDGVHYLVFGGIWGGQLQRYRNNKAIACGKEPADHEPALCPKIVRLRDDMLEFAEAPRDLVILDEKGEPLKAGDHARRFFEASWMHKYNGKYYYSYSTGDTHFLCYATSDTVHGPFTYQGIILTPVVGWTTHHSICEFKGKWHLFHHDSKPSGGRTWLRSLKVIELEHLPDGSIKTIPG